MVIRDIKGDFKCGGKAMFTKVDGNYIAILSLQPSPSNYNNPNNFNISKSAPLPLFACWFESSKCDTNSTMTGIGG